MFGHKKPQSDPIIKLLSRISASLEGQRLASEQIAIRVERQRLETAALRRVIEAITGYEHPAAKAAREALSARQEK